MPLPAVSRNWIISPNNRVSTSTGMTGSMQGILYGQKNFLVANGYVLKGTGANGTGAMDGVDRWSSAAAIVAGTAQAASVPTLPAHNTGVLGDAAWVCLTDGNGADLLMTWFGATPDICRISYSPNSLFVTSSYHVSGGVSPTGSDEAHFVVGSPAFTLPIIGVITPTAISTTQDRLWSGWVSSDRKACRFVVASAGTFVGVRWGLETVQMTTWGGACQWSGSWGFCSIVNSTPANEFSTYNIGGSEYHGGLASMTIGGVRQRVQLVMGTELYNVSITTWSAARTDAQGDTGWPIFPIGIGGLTAGMTGKFGNIIDHWIGRCSTSANVPFPGDTYGQLQFIVIGGTTATPGMMWPWDGVTVPVML